jgi:hypothetical protein
MKQTTPQYLTISIIVLSAIFASLVTLCAALPPPHLYPPQIMPFHPSRTKDIARRHLEDKAMVAVTFQKEKDAAEKDELEAAIEKDNLNGAAVTPKDLNKQMCKDEPEIIPPHEPLTTVVSPPSAPNLTSLLTGHVGQEVGAQAANNS